MIYATIRYILRSHYVDVRVHDNYKVQVDNYMKFRLHNVHCLCVNMLTHIISTRLVTSRPKSRVNSSSFDKGLALDSSSFDKGLALDSSRECKSLGRASRTLYERLGLVLVSKQKSRLAMTRSRPRMKPYIAPQYL